METPNPENRKRIVDSALAHIKSTNPNLITPPKQDDLEEVLNKVEAATRKINTIINPIADSAKDSGLPITKQQSMLLQTLHKLWLDELQQFNEDEIRFLCALVHAHTMRDNYI